jgi:hypothetical protein
MAFAAGELGASEAEGRALARYQYERFFGHMPERYRSSECADGARLDIHPASAAWP